MNVFVLVVYGLTCRMAEVTNVSRMFFYLQIIDVCSGTFYVLPTLPTLFDSDVYKDMTICRVGKDMLII